MCCNMASMYGELSRGAAARAERVAERAEFLERRGVSQFGGKERESSFSFVVPDTHNERW